MTGGASIAAQTETLTLAEIQNLVQSAILSGDDHILSLILDNSRTSRSTLFGVYRNAYAGRLVDVIRNDFAALAFYLGDDLFDEVARKYIETHPSRTQNARWFSQRFPEFLSSQPCVAANPEIADIAALEKALLDAFDAADAPVLDLAGLAAHPPEIWGKLTFAPHPSSALVQTKTNALELWRALKDNVAPSPAVARPDGEPLLVWRQGTTPRVRLLGSEEAMLWLEAGRGVRFEVLCELAATFDDAESAAARVAGYLQGWLQAGALTSCAIEKIKQRRRQVPT